MWANYTPHPYLEEYLRRIGHPKFDPRDPRSLFFELEEKGTTNVERFMEFVWENRDAKFPVSETPAGRLHIWIAHESAGRIVWPRWENDRRRFGMTYNIMASEMPLLSYLIQCFHENGVEFRSFELTKSVATKYGRGDLILNLNYDTVFEMALIRLRVRSCMLPTTRREMRW